MDLFFVILFYSAIVFNVVSLAAYLLPYVRFSLRTLLIIMIILNCGMALIYGTKIYALQFAGGCIIIVLMACVLLYVFDRAKFAEARQREKDNASAIQSSHAED